MEILRTIETKRDAIDLEGCKIPKGTTLYVIKEGPTHPRLGHKVLVVRIDNGVRTDKGDGLDLSFMPETAIRDSDL